MALFGFGKKKEEEHPLSSGCGCGSSCSDDAMTESEEMKLTDATVKVLGSGCAKCNELEAATREALKELGMESTIDHVTDFTEIAAYGVMSTPALVVDGKVVSYGKVLKKEEVMKLLQTIRKN